MESSSRNWGATFNDISPELVSGQYTNALTHSGYSLKFRI